MKDRTSISMEGEDMHRYATLDAGCGECFRGDVNVDSYASYTKALLRDIPNFVYCTIEYLPFKNRTFRHVKSYHVIEHVDKPYLALKELIRVSDYHVTVKCPHRFGMNAKGGAHKNHLFTRTWFVKALHFFQTYFSDRLYFRTGISEKRTFFWFLPEEITVEVFRGRSID
jgi:ubiquinone/menaquinone biosynthesis C-methylase UbiE